MSLEEGGNNLEELTVLNVYSVWFNNQCDNTVPLSCLFVNVR